MCHFCEETRAMRIRVRIVFVMRDLQFQRVTYCDQNRETVLLMSDDTNHSDGINHPQFMGREH
jgi:hypothetical protein